MKIKDFSDAMIKVASINDDRIKAWDDFRKGMELYDKIRRILSIRNQYQAIANWLFWNELTKGYYTSEDSALGRSCLNMWQSYHRQSAVRNFINIIPSLRCRVN